MSKDKVSVAERAARYLAKMGPAVSGAGGHTHTLLCARALVRGFLLSPSEALGLLENWNQGNCEENNHAREPILSRNCYADNDWNY